MEATLLKFITAVSIALMASGCSIIEEDGYKIFTNNKLSAGYGTVYQSPSFKTLEGCESALPQFRSIAIEEEIFFCGIPDEPIQWKFWK